MNKRLVDEFDILLHDVHWAGKYDLHNLFDDCCDHPETFWSWCNDDDERLALDLINDGWYILIWNIFENIKEFVQEFEILVNCWFWSLFQLSWFCFESDRLVKNDFRKSAAILFLILPRCQQWFIGLLMGQICIILINNVTGFLLT